jgi:hypothetical protein
MKSLYEHNAKKIQAGDLPKSLTLWIQPTGIACPKCGAEMFDIPLRHGVHCV